MNYFIFLVRTLPFSSKIGECNPAQALEPKLQQNPHLRSKPKPLGLTRGKKTAFTVIRTRIMRTEVGQASVLPNSRNLRLKILEVQVCSLVYTTLSFCHTWALRRRDFPTTYIDSRPLTRLPRVLNLLWIFLPMKKIKVSNVLFRKAARTGLVLVPLFGLHFTITIYRPSQACTLAEEYYLYVLRLVEGLQGCIVAVTYCYVNSEVTHQIRSILFIVGPNRIT